MPVGRVVVTSVVVLSCSCSWFMAITLFNFLI